jgi:hypothetical protein
VRKWADYREQMIQAGLKPTEDIAGAGAGGVTLGVPATPVVSNPANIASTLPTGTYYVKVVALTWEGFQKQHTTRSSEWRKQ